MIVHIATPDDMHELGRRIARQLSPGDVVALTGELGAGKTTLTRGIGEQLGVRGTVTSPTFVLARTHPRTDGVPLVHVDAYRLGHAAELDDLDIDFAGSITVVEWPGDMLAGVSDSILAITIDRPTGGGPIGGGPDDAAPDDSLEPVETRTVTINPTGPRWSARPFV